MAPAAKKCTTNPGLAEALARPENKVCADCGVRGASWASVNLGLFVCMECSALHRKIGVHISVVKSSTLDTWQPKWIETCTKVGNRIATDYYEHRLPCNFPRPGKAGGTSLSMEEWIRAKYERLDYAPTNRGRTCLAPSELVKDGRDPDVYSRQEDVSTSSGDSADRTSSSASKGSRLSEETERATVTPKASFTSKEDAAMIEVLTEYYARIGEAKSHEQLLLIVERYRGKEETLYAQLEKKYNQPVRMAPATPSTACSSPSGIAGPSTVCSNAVMDSGLLIPDVFKVEAEAVQRQQVVAAQVQLQQQQALAAQVFQQQQAVQLQQKSQDQSVNVLQHNLSALYQQSAQQSAPAPSPVLAASGANYNDLMCMQPTMDAQQVAWMQQQAAMQQMQQMASMQQMQQMQQQQQIW